MSVCLSQKSLIHGKINMTLVVYYSPRDEVQNALEINWELDAVLCNICKTIVYIYLATSCMGTWARRYTVSLCTCSLQLCTASYSIGYVCSRMHAESSSVHVIANVKLVL